MSKVTLSRCTTMPFNDEQNNCLVILSHSLSLSLFVTHTHTHTLSLTLSLPLSIYISHTQTIPFFFSLPLSLTHTLSLTISPFPLSLTLSLFSSSWVCPWLIERVYQRKRGVSIGWGDRQKKHANIKRRFFLEM